jgi:hypothetical protein
MIAFSGIAWTTCEVHAVQGQPSDPEAHRQKLVERAAEVHRLSRVRA